MSIESFIDYTKSSLLTAHYKKSSYEQFPDVH